MAGFLRPYVFAAESVDSIMGRILGHVMATNSQERSAVTYKVIHQVSGGELEDIRAAGFDANKARARFPLDNNPAEAALRRVALGRKNHLFVGYVAAGGNLAGLYAVIATAESNGINPVEYLTDVLVRVNTHPANRIDELLPHKWQGPPSLHLNGIERTAASIRLQSHPGGSQR